MAAASIPFQVEGWGRGGFWAISPETPRFSGRNQLKLKAKRLERSSSFQEPCVFYDVDMKYSLSLLLTSV